MRPEIGDDNRSRTAVALRLDPRIVHARIVAVADRVEIEIGPIVFSMRLSIALSEARRRWEKNRLRFA